MLVESGHRVVSPFRYYGHHGIAGHCPLFPVFRCHPLNAHASGKDVVCPVFLSHYRVVNHGFFSYEISFSLFLVIVALCNSHSGDRH